MDGAGAETALDTVTDQPTQRPATFSSENFKISIHNLPKYVDPKELKKFLKRFELDVKKAYVVRDHAYVCLADEESVTRALDVLRNYTWKKSVLRVKRAAANVDPVIAASKKQKSMPDTTEESNVEDQSKSSEIRLLDAVSPLHNLPYVDQLELKHKESESLLKKISHSISTIGDCDLPDCGYFGQLLGILPSPIIEGYRNKCEFSIGFDCDHRPIVGFRLTRYKAGSVEIVSPEKCVHVPEMTKRIVQTFQKFMEDSQLAPYDITERTGFWSMFTVRQFLMDVMVIVTVYQNDVSQEVLQNVKTSLIDLFSSTFDDGMRVTSLYFQRMGKSSDAAAYEHLSGAPYVYENVLDLRFRISPGAFFQVNTAACGILYKSLSDLCEIDKETMVLDLCCGTGTIGIVLAGKAKKVLGIESCAEAVDDARINARNNERDNCEFICGKVENVIEDIRRRTADCSRVVGILDPPRSGLPGKVISTIRQLTSMKTLLFVSCNPDAATKNFLDLTRRSSNRYPGQPFALKLVQPVDLFPHTKHCEWILAFER